ncbi:MAG: hypothetical protein IT556_15240 [Acetobacteraceae bacterium]|nr:hypothetical protein [Acetobacteraceae bacterium]
MSRNAALEAAARRFGAAWAKPGHRGVRCIEASRWREGNWQRKAFHATIAAGT